MPIVSSTSACREGLETKVLLVAGRTRVPALTAERARWVRCIVAENTKERTGEQSVVLDTIQIAPG